MHVKKITQKEIIKEYFINNPNRDIKHPEVVDRVASTYKKRTNKVPRDPDRAIRKLAQCGFLIKKGKGVYRYDPNCVFNRELEDFTLKQKRKILKRDGYKCVVCGKSAADGIELQVDHIKPKDLGGKAIIENGQTLCAKHNYRKKNCKQTESGKKMFIRLYELAKKIGDKKFEDFCRDILFDKHDINGHIEWKK
uniref:Type II restriction enzyme n=1 Tax=Candidatus Endomicrobium sp. MdDo-005 TaxID=1837115 RepID=A0A1C9ZYE8_9BACT|nr:type II restriction enzyme [Candidatus Endomicrobium sp. MdDo-005]